MRTVKRKVRLVSVRIQPIFRVEDTGGLVAPKPLTTTPADDAYLCEAVDAMFARRVAEERE